ncbi:MAG: hypothetical protein GVY16_05295 [Planctomycetes bacterium]|jgi:peptidoglycan/LPS O-acetylase OafA/YrhL|nr:hypothetical protein [Planctomycetota bacterium]
MPFVTLQLTPLIIIMAFYLYMLTRFKYVRRPMFFLWGAVFVAAGLVLAALILPWRDTGFLADVVKFGMGIGSVLGFACMVLACYGGQLPERISQGRRTESMDEDELPEYLEEASQMQQRD